MRSLTTDINGRIQTAYNGELTGSEWTQIPDDEYIHPRDAPTGFEQTRYLKPAQGISFDTETQSMGAIWKARIEIDAPDTIPNDGTEAEVVFTALPDTPVDVDFTISGLSETVTIDGSYTERVTTTVAAGSTIAVSVGGSDVVATETEIEVVSP